MDYFNLNDQRNENNFSQPPLPPKQNNRFAIASMVCGIASLIICCTGFSFILGALAILFAVLSRQGNKPFESMSLTGIFSGAFGLIMGFFLIVSSFAMLKDPAFQKMFYETYEQMYGEEMADEIAEFYDFDLDTIK